MSFTINWKTFTEKFISPNFTGKKQEDDKTEN